MVARSAQRYSPEAKVGQGLEGGLEGQLAIDMEGGAGAGVRFGARKGLGCRV